MVAATIGNEVVQWSDPTLEVQMSYGVKRMLFWLWLGIVVGIFRHLTIRFDYNSEGCDAIIK